MINVAVKEGWAGGPRLTGQFRAAIAAAGYNITDDQHADVLIAHSTACFDINPKTPVRRYILIDPLYRPGKSLINCLLEKGRLASLLIDREKGWQYILKKILWETVYVFMKPRYTLFAFQKFGHLEFLTEIQDKQVIVVRNEQDSFCSKDIETALTSYKNIYYVELPGGHTDYMSNPEPYISLLPEGLL